MERERRLPHWSFSVGALMLSLTIFATMPGCSQEERSSQGPDSASSEELPVREFHALYYHVADSLGDLAKQAAVVVRARALGSTQQPGEDPEIVYTHQRFEVIDLYFGSVDPQFTVFLTGGVVEVPGQEDFSLSDPENPQFDEGQEYFLILARHTSVPGEFVTIGPSQGRYEILDGRLNALQSARQYNVEARLHGLTTSQAVRALHEARREP